ncbi:Uncharacterised protein [Bordetella pertussis]|nr:Uncharacterised protein [Bordetella pertussis]
MPPSASMSARICPVQGSAPKMPMRSELWRGSMPWRRCSSRILQ